MKNARIILVAVALGVIGLDAAYAGCIYFNPFTQKAVAATVESCAPEAHPDWLSVASDTAPAIIEDYIPLYQVSLSSAGTPIRTLPMDGSFMGL